MKLYQKILSGVLPGLFIIILLVILYFNYCQKRRQNFKLNPTDEIQKPDIENGLSKHPKPFKPHSISSKSSLQFHHLHKEKHEIGTQFDNTPFNWASRPSLISQAVENGWPCFSFNDMYQKAESGTWDIQPDSSELMQAVRLNPSEKISSSSTGANNNSNNNEDLLRYLSGVRMSLPLPGPLLNGFPFPQEAYFEISIMYIKPQDKKEKWYARASRKVRESGGDKIKLIGGNTSMVEDAIKAIKKERLVSDEEEKETKKKHKNNKHVVLSIGLSVGVNMANPALPGTYPDSIGFHSDGSVHLDGKKLVFESDDKGWADLERVIGCGFDPVKNKVFFTLDSKVVHSINCNSKTYSSPLYPVLVSNTDTILLVNLGQARFKYLPANSQRTPNPCFITSNSEISNVANNNTGFGFDEDSGELFSVGRVDSGWSDIVRKNNLSRDFDPDSDFFEITLKD